MYSTKLKRTFGFSGVNTKCDDTDDDNEEDTANSKF